MATRAAAPAGANRLTVIAVALAAASVLVMAVLAAVHHDGAGWLLQPLFGLAAVATAWKAGGTSPRNPLALGALIIGVIMIVVFLGFVIADA